MAAFQEAGGGDMTTGLLVNIDVDDLELATAFYTDALGLKIGRRFGATAVELLGATAPLYLLRKAVGSRATGTASATRNYARHWTPVHLDFVVNDIEASVRATRAAGATVESGIRNECWGRIAVCADPWGNGFCLIEFVGRGYDEIVASARE
jgi:lactoylglutathione lyase